MGLPLLEYPPNNSENKWFSNINRSSCRVSFVIFVAHGGVTLFGVIAGEFFEWPYSFSSHVVRTVLDSGGNYEMRHHRTDVSLPKPMTSRQRSFFGWFLVPGWCSGLLGIGALDDGSFHPTWGDGDAGSNRAEWTGLSLIEDAHSFSCGFWQNHI